MTISLSIFLYIYFAFLFGWLLFTLAGIYHMLKFGFKNFTTFFTTIIFIGVTITMLAVSYNFIIEIDWKTEVSLFDSLFKLQTPFN